MNTHIPRRLPSPRDFSHDARQLIIVTGLISASYFGAFALLRGLFLLRLGYDTAYLGTYYAAGALTFMIWSWSIRGGEAWPMAQSQWRWDSDLAQ